MTLEGLRLNIRNRVYLPLTYKSRRKKIHHSDFTLISNNCWGGTVYESYGLMKNSPTVGLFFMASDYIEFLSHFEQYLQAELTFILPGESRWKHENESSPQFGTYPIGLLKLREGAGVEIFFLHYHSQNEAKEKWERRVERINRAHLLVKFNDQNGCTDEHIHAFDLLPFKNKICFTVKKFPQYKSVVTVNAPKSHAFVRASYEPYGRNRCVDMNSVINNL